MKITLKCFHPENEGMWNAYKMEESIVYEFNRWIFKCPECGKEIFLIYEADKND